MPRKNTLYRVKLTGGKEERLTPVNEPGTNEYEISPNGKIGLHTFSNIYTAEQGRNHKPARS